MKMQPPLLVLSATWPVCSARELAPPVALLAVPSTTALGPIPAQPAILCAMAALTQAILTARLVPPPSTRSSIQTPA